MSFISDHINISLTDKFKFNVISSGTGSGKTYFVGKELKYKYNVESCEILFVVSRSAIVDQQAKEDEISKFKSRDSSYIDYWNGDGDGVELSKEIQIMTYDKLIEILKNRNSKTHETLQNIKVAVFDECHTMFSDTFIDNVELLKGWIRDTLYTGQKVIIGMTATPNILMYYHERWGVQLNPLNKETIINYKAKQLHCTDFKTIPYIVTTQLQGKTIIMCYSYADCIKLKSEIPNSFILISENNDKNTSEMKKIRKCIVQDESIPDTFIDEDGEEKELNVLITTSTLREGVNLRECSGVRNVVCCFSDELHVIQFAGRCRYNIDNLIVADSYIRSDNVKPNTYLLESRNQFKEYLVNENSLAWFKDISHIVEHDAYHSIKFVLSKDEKRFIDYVNTTWLVPKGLKDKKIIDKYKIYKQDDKDQFVKLACDCHLISPYAYLVTFNKVIRFMEDALGYTVESTRGVINKEKYTYKLIVDYDEDKNEDKNKSDDV